MFEITLNNVLDILIISVAFGISLRMSDLVNIKRYYLVYLTIAMYIALFFAPRITQAGSFIIIYIEIIVALCLNDKALKPVLIPISFAFLIMIMLALISEVFIGMLFFFVFNLSELDIINRLFYYIANIAFVIILNAGVNLLIRKVFQNRNHAYKKKIETRDYIIVINMLFMMFLIASLLILYHNPYDKKVIPICTALICISIIVNQYIYLYFYDNKTRSAIRNNELLVHNKNLLKYNEKLERNAREIISFKHDAKNMLYSLSELVNESKDDELKKFYFDKIYPRSNYAMRKEGLYMGLEDIRELPLKSLVYCKLCEAIEGNINVGINIDGILHESKMNIMELVIVIGIMLDNALEECKGLKNSNIKVSILSNDEGEEYIIENSVRNQVDVSCLKAGYTSKGNNRGNGLRIVNDIIGKYDFIIQNVESNEYSFRNIMTIYRK